MTRCLVLLVAASVLLSACVGAADPPRSTSGVSLASLAPTASIQPTASIRPTASASPDESTTPAEPGEFALPSPACPSPAEAIGPPIVKVSIGAGRPIVASPGPSMLQTCTTTSATDTVGDDPVTGLTAHAGDVMTVTLPAGWRIVRWEGSDHPVVGDATNIWPAVDAPGGPQIQVPVPSRAGASIAGYRLWVVTAGGHAVGEIEFSVRIEIV